MAIASSSVEQVTQLQGPLHEEMTTMDGPGSINMEVLKTSADVSYCRNATSFRGSLVEACNACPHCTDQCSDVRCPTCSSKSCKTAPPSSIFSSRADDENYYTMCQIRRHDHSQSAWLLVGDTIYDATEYISKHPGGHMSILKKAGGKVDCAIDFDFHSNGARRMWRKCKVGKLTQCPSCRSNFGNNEQCTIS